MLPAAQSCMWPVISKALSTWVVPDRAMNTRVDVRIGDVDYSNILGSEAILRFAKHFLEAPESFDPRRPAPATLDEALREASDVVPLTPGVMSTAALVAAVRKLLRENGQPWKPEQSNRGEGVIFNGHVFNAWGPALTREQAIAALVAAIGKGK
jgi:hypothetical protein